MKDRFLHPDRLHDVGEQFPNNHQATRCILDRENIFVRTLYATRCILVCRSVRHISNSRSRRHCPTNMFFFENWTREARSTRSTFVKRGTSSSALSVSSRAYSARRFQLFEFTTTTRARCTSSSVSLRAYSARRFQLFDFTAPTWAR